MKITQIGRRLISVFLVIVVSLMLAVSPANAATSAKFAFDYPPSSETFVFELTDPEKIQEARDILSGKQKDRTHVIGRIKKSKAPYNSNWDYQLDPSTISFFSFAIEVCDSSIGYTDDHLDEAGGAFLPGLMWCPWNSRLVKEVS